MNINQLTKQLEDLKQQTEMFIKKERELEQDNDDLERNGRYVLDISRLGNISVLSFFVGLIDCLVLMERDFKGQSRWTTNKRNGEQTCAVRPDFFHLFAAYFCASVLKSLGLGFFLVM